MDLLVIGDTIRYIRTTETKLSQAEFADRIGLERTYISKIESGKKNVTIETLNSICDGLGISVSDFFSLCEKRQVNK